MAITTTQAQGLVLALFGASAGGHLTGLAAASSLNTLAGDLSTSAGLILGKDLSSNTAFRDHVTANLKLSGDALTAANAWLDGQLNAGAARGDILATAVDFLSTLTDTTSPFYASAQAFQTTVTAAVAWSTGAGATQFGVAALRAEQGNVDVVAGSSFVLTTSTAGDQIVGTAGDDVITATSATYGSADVVIDSSSSDNDTLNLAATGDITATPTVVGVENFNVNFAGFTAAGGGGAATTLEIAMSGVGATNLSVQASGSTAVNAATIDGLATGSAVTTGATFKTVSLTAIDDNATIAVSTAATSATATSILNVTSAGALVGLTVTEATGHLDLNVTAGDLDGTLTVSGAKNVDIAADSAVTADITSGKDLTITSLAAATSVTLVAAEDVTGDADLATTVSVTAGATVTGMSLDVAKTVTIAGAGVDTSAVANGSDKSSAITADLLETLNVSGNGAAFDLDITDASDTLKTINVSGDQNVTIQADAAVIDSVTKLTMTNTGTGQATLVLNGVTDAAIDISGVEASTNIVVAGTQDGGADHIKVATGSTLTVVAAQTDLEITASSTTASTNVVNVVVDKQNASTSTVAITDLTVTNVKTTNVDLSVDTAATTLGEVDVGATNNVAINVGANNLTSITNIVASTATFTGSGDLTLADLDIAVLDAAEATGDITYTAGAADVIRTGAGDDTITLAGIAADAGMDISIQTGSGNDNVSFDAADDYSDNTVVIDLGDGALDSITVGAAANISGSTVSITGVDKITFSGDATVNDTLLNGSTAAVFAGTSSDVTVVVTQATNDFSALSIDTATVSTADGDRFIISAAARTSAVNITGTDADDVITGSNTSGSFADTLNGGSGNDTIIVTEGGDAVTGGSGTDTIDFTVLDNALTTIEGSLVNATGVFVNLSAAAVTKTTIASNLAGSNIAGGLTTTAAGTFGYLYATESATAPTTVGTVATVENVTGTTGADYIVGSTAANVIDGGAGADYIAAGDGADTIVGGDGADIIIGGDGADSITGGDGNDTLTGGAGSDTFFFAATATANDSDTITDFTVGVAGDVLDFDAFLAASATVANATSSGVYVAPTPSALGASAASAAIAIGNGLLVIKYGTATTQIDEAAEIAALLGASGAWEAVDVAASKNAVIVVGNNSGTINYVWGITNDATAGVIASEISLLGTITVAADSIDAYDVANFALV